MIEDRHPNESYQQKAAYADRTPQEAYKDILALTEATKQHCKDLKDGAETILSPSLQRNLEEIYQNMYRIETMLKRNLDPEKQNSAQAASIEDIGKDLRKIIEHLNIDEQK
jgi:hypothetical protein